jgi:NAD(P)H-hydrate repair Nnr-like enzyme with NAD(P)H-hydrate dehydratase domain
VIAAPDGRCWWTSTGSGGLGTSGSGDVLAGAVAGLLARGADLDQATCWGTHLHGAAGDRLAARVGPLGYLARELVEQLPLALVELSAG